MAGTLTFERQVRKLVQHPDSIKVTSLERNPFQDTADSFAEERARLGYNPRQKRAETDWSYLNSQVVGLEL